MGEMKCEVGERKGWTREDGLRMSFGSKLTIMLQFVVMHIKAQVSLNSLSG